MNKMTSKTAVFSDNELQQHASSVQRYITEDNLPKLKETLERLRLDDRNKVIHFKIVDRAAIFVACELQKYDILKYILEECKVNVEQKGIIRGYRVELEVTPLWCVSQRNNLDIIKLLLEHGAKINQKSENGSTAVLVACEMGFGHIVHYLVNHGADINIADNTGVTCLRQSIEFPELCKYLITKGANVNASYEGQYPILHSAIKIGNLQTVKHLVEAGADTRVLDFDGNTPLLFAALCGQTAIVKYLIDKTDATTKQTVDAYDILGATAVFDGECKTGLHLWQAAILARVPKSGEPSDLGKRVIDDLMKDLEKIPCHPDAMQERAVTIMENILGPLHSETLQRLMLHAVTLMHSEEYTKSINMFMYGYHALVRKHRPLHLLQAYALTQMVQIIYNVWRKSVDDTDGKFAYNGEEEDMWEYNCIRVLKYLLTQIQEGTELRTTDPTYFRKNVTTFYNFLYIALFLIHMAYEINDMIEYFIDFQKEIRKLFQIDLKHCDRKTIFHFAVEPIDPNLYYGGNDYPGLPHPSPYVLKMLAQNGASINSKDIYGNTPLNSYLQLTPKEKQDKMIVDLMLELGAHADIVNEDGQSAITFLKESKISICEVMACSLKCISTHAILKHDIKYHGHIPNELAKFIEMHR